MKSPSSSIPFVRPSRRGFTLIELLVVIGIILILMGLFFVGGKLISGQAKERSTRTMLETCKTMFENYRNATHLSRPPPAGSGLPLDINTNNLSGRYNTARFWTVGQEPAPGVLSTDPNAYTSPSSVSLMPEALINTALVMYALKSLPENATILNNIPAGKTLNVTIALLKTGRGPSNIFTVPLLLDGWGNPILFVPGGGLGLSASAAAPGVVWIDGANHGVVTSTGTISSASASLSTYDAATPPAGTMYANQPFFVSAGVDGDFSNGHGWVSGTPNSNQTDDNVYSFK
ncbi:MAG: type II secretion system protein [Tepidisphaeraceae bacterium]